MPLKHSSFAISTFSPSAERKLRERRKKVPTIASQLICERVGVTSATCSKRLEATQWTCSGDLCEALRPQTYRRADIVHTICAILACNQSERPTHLPGYVIRDTRCYSSKSCRTAANHAHSADRRPPVGSGRPPGCPRRTPCGVRGRNLLFCFRTGHLSAQHSPKPNSTDAGPAGF